MDPVLIGFIVYLAVVLVAGGLTYKLNETQADFLLAGRRLNVWVATFSERASGESAWLLLGLPAAAMAAGLIEVWTGLGSVLGITASWWLVATRLRKETARYDALTMPDYLAKRFARHAGLIRVLAGLIIIFFYSFYVAAQFNGAGKVLNVSFGLSHESGILLGAGVIVLYTLAGGFFAVAWTDLIQAILMLCTLVVLPVVGLFELLEQGGAAKLSAGAPEAAFSWTGGKAGWVAVGAIVGGLSWGLGYAGQPHTLTRYMSVKSPDDIRRGRIIAMFWAIPAFSGAILIGILGLGLYEQGQFSDPEQLMPTMATDLLPGWLAGIFVSGAIAAMMSTADSQLLVGTSAAAEDMLHQTFGLKLDGKQLVLVSRVVTLTLGIAGVVLALSSKDLIFKLVSYAWSGLGSSFGPAILLSLHWRRTSGAGVVAGLLTGSLTTVIWSEIDALDTLLTSRVVAFVFAFLAVVVVSLLAPERRES